MKGQRGGGRGDCSGVWWDADRLDGGGHYGRESMTEKMEETGEACAGLGEKQRICEENLVIKKVQMEQNESLKAGQNCKGFQEMNC